jgi:VCBS repeat-containing protein
VTEDAAAPGNVVSGNVTGNDSSGADAPLSFVSWDGVTGADLSAYGTLVQNPTTGAWSFTLDNSLAATQALTESDVKEAVYSYTIKDADGDTSTATLTVRVSGAKDGATVETPSAEGADSTVYESGLPGGSDAAASSESATNTFTVSATDGIATVVIGGTTFTLAQLQALDGTQTVNTGEGVLTLNSYSGDSFSGTVNYTYTLSAAIDNDSKPGATDTEFTDVVSITVNGVGGTSANDQLAIAILDDVPTAVNDGPFGVTEDAAAPGNVVSGNVTANDSSGADAPLSFVSWDGATGADLSAYGTLVQNPTTGAWSFTLDNSLAATQALTESDVKEAVYSYTIKDADGDTSTATLTVRVSGAKDGATVETPSAEGADSTVYESGLPGGSDAAASSESATNTFTVSATDGIATVVIGGTTFTLAQLQALDGSQTVNTGEGVLTLNSYSGDSFSGTVNYTYTLSAAIDNDSKPGATDTEFTDVVSITVNGVGGTSANDQLAIAILDDVPTAVNDGPFGVTEDAAAPGNVAAGADG